MRGEKVTATSRTRLTRLVNPGGRRSFSKKKKDRFSRLEVKETSVDAMCVATWERPAAFHLGVLSFYFLAAGFPFFPGARATPRHAMCSLIPVFTARWGRQSRISWGVKGRGGGILYLTLMTHTGVQGCGGGKAKKTGKENSRTGRRRRFISPETHNNNNDNDDKKIVARNTKDKHGTSLLFTLPVFPTVPFSLPPERFASVCARHPSLLVNTI